MSQPVKLSDELVLAARLTSEIAERSIAGQIEFWAGLGRAVEALLRTPDLAALRRVTKAMPVSTALARAGTPAGDRQVAAVLESRPFPHYEPSPDAPGQLLRIDADGTRTLGRFIQREFVPASAPRKASVTPRAKAGKRDKRRAR